MSLPLPSPIHLARMTDDTGLFEHALGAVPLRAHGWCTDDNGRALALVCRSDDRGAERLAGTYLAFLVHAHDGMGRFRLRLAFERRWTSDPASDDADARALFGLAVAATAGPRPLRWTAGVLFDQAVTMRSPHPMAVAQVAVAAAEMVSVYPEHPGARAALADAASRLPRLGRSPAWPWPAPRLTYANALIPEGLLAAGAALGDDALVAEGLRMLAWLVQEETRDGRFSFVPAGGRGPGDPRPAFDQQPIEAASFADACARAFDITGDGSWLVPLERAAAWVCGLNDASAPVLDAETGAGHDGLTPDGVNLNQGAESTIAVIATLQQAHRLLTAPRLDAIELVGQPPVASASSR